MDNLLLPEYAYAGHGKHGSGEIEPNTNDWAVAVKHACSSEKRSGSRPEGGDQQFHNSAHLPSFSVLASTLLFGFGMGGVIALAFVPHWDGEILLHLTLFHGRPLVTYRRLARKLFLNGFAARSLPR